MLFGSTGEWVYVEGGMKWAHPVCLVLHLNFRASLLGRPTASKVPFLFKMWRP